MLDHYLFCATNISGVKKFSPSATTFRHPDIGCIGISILSSEKKKELVVTCKLFSYIESVLCSYRKTMLLLTEVLCCY